MFLYLIMLKLLKESYALHAIQLWMIICVVRAWNVCAYLSHTVRWQMTRVICRNMRRRECKLFITSVTCRLSPNQWIILLTMLIFKRHLWISHTALTTPGSNTATTPGMGLLLGRSVAVPKVGDYSWHGTTPGPWHRVPPGTGNRWNISDSAE